MKNLFIDSNIWLSLYHFTSDDLTQFEKLKDFLDKDIRLWIPHQVYDEVLRNREAKIQDAFKLVNSPNFITTHGVIAMMNKYTDWTDAQIEKLCSAVIDNTQVGWILGDDDVFEFFSRLLNNPKFHEMKECSISRVLEELHMFTQERAQEGKEDWEAEINEMKEDIEHYPWLG